MRILRFIVATAAVMAAFVAPTATAQADTTTQAYTTLPASVSPHWIARGDTATVSGTLLLAGQPYAGQSVKLRARTPWTGGGFTTVASAVTAADGTVSFDVTPIHRTIYRLRFTGNADAYGTISHRVVVHIKRHTALRAHEVVTTDGRTLVVGRLYGGGHVLARRIVELQAQVNGVWTDVASKRTNLRGRVRFPVDGPGDFRLMFGGTLRYLPSTSPIVTIG